MPPLNNRYEFQLRPLPQPAEILLWQHDALPRLTAHLILVHDVAAQLLDGLKCAHLADDIDIEAVLFGAAVHDIGKTLHPEELTCAGNQHESAGKRLLLRAGIALSLARFAETHGTWRSTPDIIIEDLLVALADTCWKGTRNPELEQCIVDQITASGAHNRWTVFLAIDNIVENIAAGADARLAWQARFAADG